jgi:hypothetical protein
MERLVNLDSHNPGWQHILANSHESIGNVLVDQGKLPAALESYRAALPIRDRLSKAEPDNPGWRVAYAGSHGSMGLILVRMGQQGEALEILRKGRDIIAPLVAAAPEQVLWSSLLASFDREIGVLAGNVVGKNSGTEVDPLAVKSELPVVATPSPAKKAAANSRQRQVPWTADIWKQRSN